MIVQLEPVDGTTAAERELRALHLVETEADERGPSISGRSLTEAIASYRNPGGVLRSRWLAGVGGETAGAAFLSRYGDSLNVGYVLVRPAYRRLGVGRALLEAVVAEARRAGIASFFGEFVGEEGRAFARAAGAVEDQQHVLSTLELRLADLPPPVPSAGMELRTWVGACPGELLESYVRARNAMADAPVPGGQAMPTWTVERQRRDEERCAARGASYVGTAALEDGEVVALTGVRVPPAPAREAITDDTATVAAARGRGLARTVKLENLRRLRDFRPDVERVLTRNGEQNGAILAVNRGLGFRPERTVTTAVLTL